MSQPRTPKPLWRRWWFYPATFVALVVVLVVVIAIDDPAPQDTTAAPASATASTQLALPDDGLTGFDATDQAWDAHHTQHPDYGNGYVYDPDPALPQVNGHTGATYTDVQHVGGRVVGYTVHLQPAPLAAAIDRARHEFPADAQVAWQERLDRCVKVEFHSATLTRAAGASGATVVLYDVTDDGSDVSNPTRFNQALVERIDEKTPDPSFGC